MFKNIEMEQWKVLSDERDLQSCSEESDSVLVAVIGSQSNKGLDKHPSYLCGNVEMVKSSWY